MMPWVCSRTGQVPPPTFILLQNIYILPKDLHCIRFITNCTIKTTVLIFNILSSICFVKPLTSSGKILIKLSIFIKLKYLS